MDTYQAYPFAPKRLALDGHGLSYIDEGAGNVVVMLHGNPTWSFFYRKLVMLLKDSHRVIVPDHLGCGLSDKPQNYPYRLKNHIDNLEALLASLDVGKITLIMHDWGGAIGMGYAARHPERIRALVVMNTAAFRSKRLPWRIRICRTPMLGPLLVRGLNAFARAAIFMAVAKPLPAEVAQGYLAPYDSWANRIAIMRFIEDIPLSESHPSWKTLLEIEAGLEHFRDTPMLLLWGGRDFCFTRAFFNSWRERFPAAAWEYFPRAGHYLLEDAFPAVGPSIASFLAQIDTPS